MKVHLPTNQISGQNPHRSNIEAEFFFSSQYAENYVKTGIYKQFVMPINPL